MKLVWIEQFANNESQQVLPKYIKNVADDVLLHNAKHDATLAVVRKLTLIKVQKQVEHL